LSPAPVTFYLWSHSHEQSDVTVGSAAPEFMMPSTPAREVATGDVEEGNSAASTREIR